MKLAINIAVSEIFRHYKLSRNSSSCGKPDTRGVISQLCHWLRLSSDSEGHFNVISNFFSNIYDFIHTYSIQGGPKTLAHFLYAL